MLFFVLLRLAPRRYRTAARFRAPDPWNEGRPAEFSIEAYKMLPKPAGAVRDVTPSRADRFGLRSEIDGRERLMPESLAALWKQGQVPPEALPSLLARIAPTLRDSDYATLLHAAFHRWVGAIFAVLAALFLLGARSAFAGRGHATVRVPVAAWLARPLVDDESIVAEGAVPIEGFTKVAFEPAARPSLVASPAPDGYALAWIGGGSGHRLLLLDRPPVGETAVYGVTMRSTAAGIPAAAVADVRRRVPDLEGDPLVTCEGFAWMDGESANAAFVFFLAMAAIAGLGGAVPFVRTELRKARRRRQMAWLLAVVKTT